MTPLERAGQAVGIRPLLWRILSEDQLHILRARLQGHAYTAIAETRYWGTYTPQQVKAVEQVAIDRVLQEEKLAIKLDRKGLARRYT